MRNTFQLTIIIVFFSFCSCKSAPVQNKKIPTIPKAVSVQETSQEPVDSSFILSYTYAGLGSQMGSMEPVFTVMGKSYVYTLEQNSSFNGKYDKKPELICKGKIRASSIDSILDLIKDIKEPEIYRTNVNISSGGIHYISIESGKTKVNFKLHNAYDETAQKIVDILNSNIPAKKRKLWIFQD